jgi:hypothetical protein
MVTAEEKGKVKVLTLARAKQGGSVDPTRQVTVEQVHKKAPRVMKAGLKLGNHPGPSPGLPHAFSLTNGSVVRKRNATRSKNMKRRGTGLKKRRAKEN